MPERVLNPQQKEAITYGKGPLLIIAGAGTGKTTVITERMKHLIVNENILPSEILALTFTEKAATEMETRIDEGMPYGYSELWIQTFHGFCDRVLRAEAVHIGLNPKYDLLTETESLMFLRKHLFEFTLEYFRPLGNPMKFLQAMLSHFSRLRDDDIHPKDYLRYATNLQKKTDIDESEKEKTLELAQAFMTYETLKAREGVMDFSDLISNTLQLFRKRKNILMYYQKKFQYVFVDEFQDTNFAQNELAILLAGDDNNITVVGDDDQSIYRWRGAAIANMMQFRSHFPTCHVVTLTKNYRSTQYILDKSYEMIQNNNPYRLEVKENIAKKLTSERAETGEEITFLYGKNADDEAEQIVSKIKEEIKIHKRSYRDFAILVRANDHSLPFQRALERKKIPFQFLGPGKLFQQEVIKDLIAYLRVLANFDDTASLYRIITNPIFAFNEVEIATFMTHAKKINKPLFKILEQADHLDVTQETKEKLTRLITMMKKHLAKVPKENAGQILYAYFEESGLLGHYLDPGTIRTEEEAQNIAKFFERLQSYISTHDDVSIFAIVDWIDLAMELGESPQAAEIDWSENNAVNILTVHSSKGLEFPVVFVVNLVTQRFPGRDRKEPIPVPDDLIKEQLPQGNDNLQEERRLFYVAMTRARDKLYLSAAKFYGDGKRERKISPFIFEALGNDIVNKVINKKKLEDAAEQLSLLDALKPVVNEKETASSHTNLHTKEPIKIDFISYSQLQTFDICPLHYKLKYLMKIPPVSSPAMSFGISVHSMLKYLYEEGFGKSELSNETLSTILKRSWLSEGYESQDHEEEAKKAAKTLLLKYIRENHIAQLPTYTEYPFQFFINNIKVLGRFDRIDTLPDKSLEIIDYKTGNNIPDEKKIKKDLQLTIYALAASQMRDPVFTSSNDTKLTLYYVESNTKVSTFRTKEEIELAQDEIIQRVQTISSSDFHCSRSVLCKNCEYKMLCSAFAH